jgi:WD40 repeat protein
LRKLGFAAVAQPQGYRLDPVLPSLRAAVRETAAAAPVIVLYYTGHGADLERGTYYLVGKDSRPADLSESALAARDLLTLFTLRDDQGRVRTDQPTVLVILDCCYSGAAGMTMLEEASHGIGNPHIWMIASTGPLEYAQQGVFADALRKVLERPTIGPSQRYVDPLTVVDAINDMFGDRAAQQARLFQPAAGAARVPPFFPNPGYRPGVAGLTVADQHWISRVRGGPEESTTGFYLTGKTGRLRAAEDLITWISDSGRQQGQLALVTGSPGTGKSALLALPALLTERSWRQELLRVAAPGSLIAQAARLLPSETQLTAVHARGLNADQTAGAIARALGREASTAFGLLESLDVTPWREQGVIAVDALDEAVSPATLLSGLLVPLARQHGLRIVAGARRHVLSDVDADLIIDLDTGQYQDPGALTNYVYRLLTAAEEPGVATPYRAGPDAGDDLQAAMTTEVAAAIAQQATARDGGPESFLIGRLLALSARSRAEPLDVTSEGWQTDLPASVAEAFDEDLASLGDLEPLARILLATLAWAKGPGLPWENIWTAVARALAAHLGLARAVISDDDIRWLLRKAGAYVVEDLGPGGRSVYRPFHDLLAAHLRGETAPDDPSVSGMAERRRRAAIERVITDALLATVPLRENGQHDWPYAHPYLRTYLAQHAWAAGSVTLTALVEDRDFLSVADPVTLTTVLSPTFPETRELARTYRRARPLLGADPQANAAYLGEASVALAGPGQHPHTAIPPLYRTRLASIRRDDSLLTLTGLGGAVLGVAFGPGPDGSLLLAAASDRGTVRVWDPLTGGLVSGPAAGRTNAVTTVAFAVGQDGRLLLATGSEDGTVRLQDPLTGAQLGKPFRANWVSALALTTRPDGRLLLATGSPGGTARLWDPLTGLSVGKTLIGHRLGVYSLAFGTGPDGGLLLASGGLDGTVRLWDTLARLAIGAALTGHSDRVSSLAFAASQDGRLLLASGSDDETVRLWDPLAGVQLGKRLTGRTGGVSSLAFAAGQDGQPMLASGGLRGTVRLWDPVAGKRLDRPLIGHSGGVRSVAFGASASPDGGLLLASGDSDGTVRLWDPLMDVRPERPLTRHRNSVYSVAFADGEDGLVLASGGDDGKVRLWDPVRGSSLGEPLAGHTGRVLSVGFGGGAGAPLLASGGSDGTVRLWDPPTGGHRGGAFGEPLTGHAGRVLSVAFGPGPAGKLLLASSGSDGTVRLWDPTRGYGAVGWDTDTTREWLAQPIIGPARTVSSVACSVPFADLDAGLLAAAFDDGTIQLWPLSGQASGWRRLAGHDGRVLSLAFGPGPGGGPVLASGGSDATVRLWHPSTGQQLGQPLSGHAGPVNSVAFAVGPGDRGLLASGSDDRTVRLWDLATGATLAVLRRRSSVYALAAAGAVLAIGDAEGLAVIELSPLPESRSNEP